MSNELLFIQLISENRLSRYRRGKNINLTPIQLKEFYLWNCKLSESLYTPIHFFEIIMRNTISEAFKRKLGDDWLKNTTLHKIMDERFLPALNDLIHDKGINTTQSAISKTTMSLWEHFLTKRFDKLIWNNNFKIVFPYTPANKTRIDVQKAIHNVRLMRNRIFHQKAIFDQSPNRIYFELLETVSWVHPDALHLIKENSRFQHILKQRP